MKVNRDAKMSHLTWLARAASKESAVNYLSYSLSLYLVSGWRPAYSAVDAPVDRCSGGVKQPACKATTYPAPVWRRSNEISQSLNNAVYRAEPTEMRCAESHVDPHQFSRPV